MISNVTVFFNNLTKYGKTKDSILYWRLISVINSSFIRQILTLFLIDLFQKSLHRISDQIPQHLECLTAEHESRSNRNTINI